MIEKLEKIQKRATKLVIAVKTLKYEERLKYLNLPTLKYRRLRGIAVRRRRRAAAADSMSASRRRRFRGVRDNVMSYTSYYVA